MKYLIFLPIILFLPNLTMAAVANVDHIVFVSEQQTVSLDTISKILTIQTQNSNGVAEPIDETGDLSVTVTSPTGQFNSNATTWNPSNTFTMSKNTANKNFYYKDTTVGTYTITATLTTRVTGKIWSASQNITIGEEVINVGGGEVLGTSTPAVIATSTSSIPTTVVSTHYITESVSVYVEPTGIFEISAGRERSVYLGQVLFLEAKSKKSKDLEGKSCKYLWSMGDGFLRQGEEIKYSYKYPGQYNLVLNAKCGDRKSVSRTKVTVSDLNLSYDLSGFGELIIINQGSSEVNLYGFKSVLLAEGYEFPIDTIISAGQKIVLPRELTFLKN